MVEDFFQINPTTKQGTTNQTSVCVGQEYWLPSYGANSRGRGGSSVDLSSCPQLSPTDIILLKYVPLTSASVERSFNRYRDLLTIWRVSFPELGLTQHLFVQINADL